jgi:protein CWC15
LVFILLFFVCCYSDEDDTAELLKELQKIKKERAEEQARKEQEKKEEEERIRTENLLKGNPLLNQQNKSDSFQVKRRWDDDVIFKNCAKSDFDKKEQHFINDTIRSEFHRKFMDKYVK